MMKKIIGVVWVVLLSASFVSAQTVVELAKKEKERRERLKGKSAKVITNADLSVANRRASIEIVAGSSAGQGAGQPVGEGDEPEYTAEGAPDFPRVRSGPGGGEPDSGGFARTTMEGTALVKNPGYALQSPDGRYAEIAFQGCLDLDFIASNGPGDDIAIFARRSGSRGGQPIEDGLPAGEMEIQASPGMLFYGVLVLTNRGEWRELGTGVGIFSPETFDLGDIERISAIKIVFRPLGNVTQNIKELSLAPSHLTMGIDAIQALH